MGFRRFLKKNSGLVGGLTSALSKWAPGVGGVASSLASGWYDKEAIKAQQKAAKAAARQESDAGETFSVQPPLYPPTPPPNFGAPAPAATQSLVGGLSPGVMMAGAGVLALVVLMRK